MQALTITYRLFDEQYSNRSTLEIKMTASYGQKILHALLTYLLAFFSDKSIGWLMLVEVCRLQNSRLNEQQKNMHDITRAPTTKWAFVLFCAREVGSVADGLETASKKDNACLWRSVTGRRVNNRRCSTASVPWVQRASWFSWHSDSFCTGRRSRAHPHNVLGNNVCLLQRLSSGDRCVCCTRH